MPPKASNPNAKTFENQDKLPRLPVPPLEQSLQGYIKSLEPLVEQKVSSAVKGRVGGNGHIALHTVVAFALR